MSRFMRYDDVPQYKVFTDFKDPLGTLVYVKEGRHHRMSAKIAVCFDLETGHLLNHGYEPACRVKFNQARSLSLYRTLVLTEFDARETGVEWLNRSISHSGTTTQNLIACFKAKGWPLPPMLEPYAT